jgi:hypothetical protein
MADADGNCVLPINQALYKNCIGTNMTYTSAGVVQTCSHCDYGYSLDQDNNCKLQCAEGCLKCNELGVCIECDHYRNWWSTSPHNCTNPTFDYYYPNYNSNLLNVAISTLMIGFCILTEW